MDLTTPSFYPARTQTFSAGDPVPSSTLNAIQDGVVDAEDALGVLVTELEEQAAQEQTATTNQADSPAPDVGGARTIWVERATNGTSNVTLDNAVDWRDRWVFIRGEQRPNSRVPGGALETDSDSALRIDWMFYSGTGQTGGSTIDYCAFIPPATSGLGTDHIHIYVNSVSGALLVKKDGSTDVDTTLVLRIEGSPVQNHH